MSGDTDHELPAAELRGMARMLGRHSQFEGSARAEEEALPLIGVASLEQRFEILDLVDRGGMGTVYRARRRSDGSLVAIKVLAVSLSGDPLFRERFARESEALTRLSHPNIVSIVEFIDEPDGCGLVMELVEGESLRAIMDRELLPPDRAIEIIREIGSALEFAHNGGVVHRDVKPNNILLDPNGNVKVVDFGLAKLIGQSGSSYSLTATGSTLGTPIYVAPELCQGTEDADHRVDIYSLGVLSYELLAGKLPLGMFRPPSKERSEVPPSLDSVILKALENRAEDRFRTVSEMMVALGVGAEPQRTHSRKLTLAVACLGSTAAVIAIGGVIWGNKSNQVEDPSSVQKEAELSGQAGAPAFVNSLGMQFVLVAGTDVLFSIWETRVADFRAFVKASGHDARAGFYSYADDDDSNEKVIDGHDWEMPGFHQTESHPVTGTNWSDAVAFCEWLTDKEQASGHIAETQRYRLAEDDEWTTAVDLRGNYPWGDDDIPPSHSGNFAGMELEEYMPNIFRIPGYEDGHAVTSPVGSFPANKFGIFDLAGNVWEWTGNQLDESRQATFRGACWTNGNLGGYDSGLSNRWDSGLRVNDIGFRVVLTAEDRE